MVRDLILRMAAENPDWGYMASIYGNLKKLGYDVHWQPTHGEYFTIPPNTSTFDP